MTITKNYYLIIFTIVIIVIVIALFLNYSKKETKFIIEHTNNPTTSYQYILSSNKYTLKFKKFLIHIFSLLPPDELYNFIFGTHGSNKNINDSDMFMKIKNYTENNYNKLTIIRNFHILLNEQEVHIGKCMGELLLRAKLTYPLNNYLSIGDSGKYINIIKETLNIDGNIYIINDTYNYFEHINSPFSIIKNKFIQYDYDQMPKFEINDNVDLVTCLIGLHHFKEEKLNQFLKNIYDVVKPNGIFIIREHNGNPDIIPLLNCAHNVFNAVTGETLETEENELRNFKPINEWIQIVESVGFKNMNIHTIQKNDPTENYFILFTKPDNDNFPKALKNISHNNPNFNYNYKRPLCQTYLTMPEWFSVDIIKEYGDFMEHTPWYDYPYGQIIIKYWKLFFYGIYTSISKCGVSQTFGSWSYIFMNIIIGIMVTIMFIQLGLLSIIPSFFYHLPGNNEIEKIQMMIVNDNNVNLKDIDNTIKIIHTENKYSIIETMRYKKFLDIVLKLINNKIDIVEIAGQTEIQARVTGNDTLKDKLLKMDDIDILYEYKMFDESNEKDVMLNIKVNKICELVANNINIKHIYDY